MKPITPRTKFMFIASVLVLLVTAAFLVGQESQKTRPQQPPIPITPDAHIVECGQWTVSLPEVQTWAEYSLSQGCRDIEMKYLVDGFWQVRSSKLVVNN